MNPPKDTTRSSRTAGRIALSVFLLIGGVLLWRATRPEAGTRSGSTGDSASTKTVGLEPEASLRPLEVSGVEHSPTSIRFKLRRNPNLPLPGPEERLIFCVPEGRTFRTEILSYQIGAERFFPRDEDADPTSTLNLKAGREKTLQLKDLGVMRRWRLAGLEIRPDFFSSSRAAAPRTGQPEEVLAEIAIRWEQPVESSAEPAFSNEIEPTAGWGRVGRWLVEDPEGLKLYQIAEPPLREGIAPRASALWRLTPGQRKWARLRLEEAGLYELALEDLNAVGFAPSEIRPEKVRVFSRGEPVPLLRSGEAASQKIFFWNDALRTPYSKDKIYWVTLADDLPDPAIAPLPEVELHSAPSRRLTTTTRKARINRDNELQVQSGNFMVIETMEWVDAPLDRGGQALQIPVEFPGYVAPKGPLEAKLRFYMDRPEDSNGSGRQRIKLMLDGKPANTMELTHSPRSPVDVSQTTTLAPNEIKDGLNAFSLSLEPVVANPIAGVPLTQAPVEDKDLNLWFNEMEVTYPSRPILVQGRLTLLDESTGGQAPVWTPLEEPEAKAARAATIVALGPQDKPLGTLQVSQQGAESGILWPGGKDRRVEVCSAESIHRTPRFETAKIEDLAAESQGADYLVIAHREFLDLAQPLADFHAREGLRTRVVDVQSVYDNFSDGELSPEAIRNFLAYTLRSWRGGAPSYVLLVGDCSSDYLGKARNQVRNWVPSYTFDFRGDKWASDQWFGVVAGQDDLSEFMIGRISVENREDAETIVKKILAYAEKPQPGPWRSRLAFVADDGEFPGYVEGLRKERTPDAYSAERVYLDESMPLEDNWYLDANVVREKGAKVSPVATARIIETFRKGVSFLTYYGHGSPNLWMDERVWYGAATEHSDNRHLKGTGFTPFVTNMTCNSGAIDYPIPLSSGVNICITEDMMRVKDGGAIALYVPSGPSVTPIHNKMSLQLHRSMFENGARRLGEIVALSKSRYSVFGHPEQLAYMFILLGDPAMDLQITSHPRAFNLPKAKIRPGERMQATLAGVTPEEGRFVASLESDEMQMIWEGKEESYHGGRLPIDISIPADAPQGKAILRIYAWNPGNGMELAAAGGVEIGQPHPAISATTIARGADGSGLLTVALTNASSIPLSEGMLEVRALGAEASAAKIDSKRFSLDADGATTVSMSLPQAAAAGAGADGASAYEIAVKIPSSAGSAADPAFVPTRRTGLAPVGEWTGFVPQLGRWEELPEGRSTKIEAVALSGRNDSRTWIAGLDDPGGTTIRSLPMTVASGEGRVFFTLAGAEKDRATSGTLWLAEQGPALNAPGPRVSAVPVASIPRFTSHLRIRPGSLQTEPTDPSDGQTIFVRFIAENMGSTTSPPYTAGLYDGDPAGTGKPLPSKIGNARVRGKELDPGQSREVRLRWDPVGDAGEQKIWVYLDTGRRSGEPPSLEQKQEATIRVRTKAELRLGVTSMATEELAGGKKRLLMTGEVLNLGETDARNVSVTFYRSGIKIPENQLGEVTLPLVPAKGKETARLPITESLNLKKDNPPTHEARLKGSRQRVTRLKSEP